MHPTLALVILWAAGIVTVLAVVGSFIHWLFYDTDSGIRPDEVLIDRNRYYRQNFATSFTEYDECDAAIEAEYEKCRPVATRWRRLKAWWQSPV